MNRWILLFHTIRYLKAKQLAYQVYYRFRKPRLRNISRPVLRDALKGWYWPTFLEPATNDGRTFTFLGRTARLAESWNDPSLPKLWLYNLHYQDDLNAKGAESRFELCAQMVDAWIKGNPPLQGNGWEPYCLSLRIVNWVKWLSRVESDQVKPEWTRSLAQQADALEQQLEFHILANHVFANAKALIFVGVYLGSEQGDRHLKRGLKLLDQQLPEQFLADGGHFERSPMYQGTLLWDLADLAALSRSVQLKEVNQRAGDWERCFVSGVGWLETMTHPDGDISFFNDATFGISPGIEELKRFAHTLGLAVTQVEQPAKLQGEVLHSSGYGVVDWPKRHRLLVDLAPVGPDYQPGHAHADTLSCELSLFGQRVLVNSGISQYGDDAERHRQRSTAAHNTVELDGENSTEVWAGFRVARRAEPFNVAMQQDEHQLVIQGSHNGYRRLPGKIVHRRRWLARNISLEVVDELEGRFQKAVCHWHFHPDIAVERDGESRFKVRLPSGQVVLIEVSGGSAYLAKSSWHPGFGISIDNQKLIIVFSDRKVTTRVCWSSD
ncbi:heparinase [Marinobacter vulgaris]|uniref:Heparinase n=1 Tax=Marinobacter vulgaris TaxID=1928331 RepID=A0A2V3ZGP9_9GAMM|nr:heparinase II/III family protein [Marinobacter vulgaris]PXX88893.1 heparinase [Marinobacter vulgaris]TSJ66676.1 alginate lyase family protein [Marinobacter vulgaris]